MLFGLCKGGFILMKRQIIRKLTAAVTSLAAAASCMAALQTGMPAVSAANSYWKFDFGSGGVASGYTGVSAGDGYNAGRGYGFSSGSDVANVGASGSGALSDAVQFKNSSPASIPSVRMSRTASIRFPSGSAIRTAQASQSKTCIRSSI